VTWRPYAAGTISATDPGTWSSPASEWGGNIFLDSRMMSQAIFFEDRIKFGPRLTVTPGVRVSRWTGYVDPLGGAEYEAVTATDLDPRLGFVYDPSGTNQFVLRAHWGIYHQGMSAALFDRVGTTSPYQDERFYPIGPTLTAADEPWSDARRDAEFVRTQGNRPPTPIAFQNRIRSESGPVVDYRQPYVNQFVGGAERAWKGQWKARAIYVHRTNHDFVGLVDRNLASNYTLLHGVKLGTRPNGLVGNFDGEVVQFADIYVRNDAVRNVLATLQAGGVPAPTGLSYGMLSSLTYNPDIVFTTIPEARRRFQQAQFSLAGNFSKWSGLTSLTITKLKGNTAGVTTLGGVGSIATAGQWVRPNEGIGSYGYLPGYSPAEGKFWVSRKVNEKTDLGITATYLMGEFFRPNYEIELGRYRLIDSLAVPTDYPDELFEGVLGQTIYLEPGRSRNYGDRLSVDLRAERRVTWRGSRILVTADVFNVLDEREPIQVHTSVNSIVVPGTTATIRLTNPRLRMPPRIFRIGTRVEFGPKL
jgi:hypothetical protein